MNRPWANARRRPSTRVRSLFFIFLLVGIGSFGCQTPAAKREAAGLRDPGKIVALGAAGPPTRVVLISVAGLEASDFLAAGGFIADAGQSVRMPQLAKLAGEGVVGVRAMAPSPGSIMASHATLSTGKNPARHGVIADSQLAANGAVTGFQDRATFEGEAVWDAAIGRGVLALGWPSTLGARIELLLPEIGPAGEGESPWVQRIRRHASSILVRGLEEIEREALALPKKRGETSRGDAPWPTPAEKDAAFSELACQVAFSDRDPGLWLIRLNQTEAALRRFGSGSAELASALRRVDDEIGSILDCLAETDQLGETALFIVGDVTFRPVHSRVDPNVALVQRGLIGRDPRAETGVRSWLAQVRSHGRSAYVYAKDARNALAARDILEGEARKTGAFRVVPAAELAGAGVDPQAWFGLEAEPGYEIGNGLTRPVLRPSVARAREGALAFPEGDGESVGFVAWGRGVRSKIRLPELSLADVSPTIAMLLGLRLELPIDGRPLAGILRAAQPAPPPGPKRIGVGRGRDVDRTLEGMGGGRRER